MDDEDANVTELGSTYETAAPEMRIDESGRPKSVKWHRLDYYEIAPLSENGDEKAGVLSRGGLMRRTAKRLRSENPVVQVAAIHRCAADFRFLVEGPCLRPLLESIRDLGGLAGMSRPTSPGEGGGASSSAPLMIASAPLATHGEGVPTPQSQHTGRMPRDKHGYGPNLTAALRALGAFMKDEEMEIPEGVLELAGESKLDGRQADEHVDKNKKDKGARSGAAAAAAARSALPPAEAPASPTSPVSASDAGGSGAESGGGADGGEGTVAGSNGGDSTTSATNAQLKKRAAEAGRQELLEAKAAEAELVVVKQRNKRAKLIAKEMQRKKTLFEATDLLTMMTSPLNAVSDASLWLYEALVTALRDAEELGLEASTVRPSSGAGGSKAGDSQHPGGGGGGEDEHSVAITRNTGGMRSMFAGNTTADRTGTTRNQDGKAALLTMLTMRGNPPACLAAIVPNIKGWRDNLKESLERKAALDSMVGLVKASSAQAQKASAEATEAANDARARAAEARGEKKRKKPLPPALADELAAKEEEEAAAAAAALEADTSLKSTLQELKELGGGKTSGAGKEGHKNEAALSIGALEQMVARTLRMVHFLWELLGEQALVQLMEASKECVPGLLELLVQPPSFDATRRILHGLSRHDVPGGTAALVLSGGSAPIVASLEAQIVAFETQGKNALKEASSPKLLKDKGLGQAGAEQQQQQPPSGVSLLVLVELVDIVAAMASCDRASLASNPKALALSPATPLLIRMANLDHLPHADKVTLNTAVISALSSCALRGPKGRLEVCEQGVMPLLVKVILETSGNNPFNTTTAGEKDGASAAAGGDDSVVSDADLLLLAKERNLRRTADKALLHLLYSAADTIDPKIFTGKRKYLPPASVCKGLASAQPNGRRRVTRLVATLTQEPECASALGPACVGALTASVRTWREVLAEIEEQDEARAEAQASELASSAARAQAQQAAGKGLPLTKIGGLPGPGSPASSRGHNKGRGGGGGGALGAMNEDEEEEEDDEDDYGEDDEGGLGDDGLFDLAREDVTEVDGLGEVLYALQALGNLIHQGGHKSALAVGSDELVGMLVDMLFECGRQDGSEVDHRLCVVTDLSWEFNAMPGEELSVEYRVLRAEAVNLLTALAHIPETAPRVARHAGLALKMVGEAYGCFAPALREGVPVEAKGTGQKALAPAWRFALDPKAAAQHAVKTAAAAAAAAGGKEKGVEEEDDDASKSETSPQLMLALLRLIEKLATSAGGREGLYLAAVQACNGERPGLVAEKSADASHNKTPRQGDTGAATEDPAAAAEERDEFLPPLFFTVPRADVFIGDLLGNSVPPPPEDDAPPQVSYRLAPNDDGTEWEEAAAPLKEVPPNYASFRPTSFVLMGVVGALSGGTMDMEQLQSALVSFRALCRDDAPPPPSYLTTALEDSEGNAKSGGAGGSAAGSAGGGGGAATGGGGSKRRNTKPGLPGGVESGPSLESLVAMHSGSDGNQPVLADTFSATAVRLGALVALVLLPQAMPVVAGGWGVAREASELAEYLVNRGAVREYFWTSLPQPATIHHGSSGGGDAKGGDAKGGSSHSNASSGKDKSQPPSASGGGGGSQASLASAGSLGLVGGAGGQLAQGDGLSTAVRFGDGVLDPNKGPNRAQWAPLLNSLAWIQPTQLELPPPSVSTAALAAGREASAEALKASEKAVLALMRDRVAPPPGSEEATTDQGGRGAYWSPLHAAVGAMPLWSPITLQLDVASGGGFPSGTAGGSIEVVVSALPSSSDDDEDDEDDEDEEEGFAEATEARIFAAAETAVAANSSPQQGSPRSSFPTPPGGPPSPLGGGSGRKRPSSVRDMEASELSEVEFTVELVLLSATDLPNADVVNKADPFVQVKQTDGDQRVLASSRVVQNEVCPVFNETLKFRVKPSQAVTLEVWDMDVHCSTLLSSADLPITLPGVNDGTQVPGVSQPEVSEAEARAVASSEGLLLSLLAGGADTEVVDALGRTPLMHALALANDAMARHLLNHGARPNARDKKGCTVLQYAFASPEPSLAKKAVRDLLPPLLNAKDPSAALPGSGDGTGGETGGGSGREGTLLRTSRQSSVNSTPRALGGGQLSPRGSYANKNKQVLSPNGKLTGKKGKTKNKKGGGGNWSSQEPFELFGDLRLVSEVLRAGGDPNEACDELGEFALHWALHGTKITFQLPVGPRGLPRALSLVCAPNQAEGFAAAKLCVELGLANVSACSKSGETPLHLLVSEGYGAECLDLLLSRGADPNLMDSKGEVPAHRFARHVVSSAPAMLGKLLEASKGKILRRAVFANERRALSPAAKMDLEVNALFAECASELLCPKSVAAKTTSVDDVLTAPTAEGWSLMHCLCGAALFEAAAEAVALTGLPYDTVRVLEESGDESSFAPMLNSALREISQGGNSSFPAADSAAPNAAHPLTGLTPAHLVLRVFPSHVAQGMVRELAAAGADLNALAELPPHPLLGGARGLSNKYRRSRGQGKGQHGTTGLVGPPLSLAVAHAHGEATARYLLDHKLVDPCPAQASPSPLHVACACGADVETVESLLAGTGVRALRTALLTTYGSGGGDEASALAGSTEPQDENNNNDNLSSASVASSSSSPTQRKAAKDKKKGKGNKSGERGVGVAVPPHMLPGLSGTPLHAAAAAGITTAIVTEDNSFGHTNNNALILSGQDTASAAAPAGGVAAVVELLLRCPSVQPNARDVAGRTALQVACLCGKPEAVRALLTHAMSGGYGGDRDGNAGDQGYGDEEEEEQEEEEEVKWDCAGSADLVLAIDLTGKTCLHSAIDAGNAQVVELLVRGHRGLASLVTHGQYEKGGAAARISQNSVDEGNEEDDDAAVPANANKNSVLAKRPSASSSTLSVDTSAEGAPMPLNLLEYAELVQIEGLTPCRLLLENPFKASKGGSGGKASPALTPNGTPSKVSKKGSFSSKELDAATATSAESPKHTKSSVKRGGGSVASSGGGGVSPSSGLKKKNKGGKEKDYGLWRKGFRAEFNLLTSTKALCLDDTVRLLLRVAAEATLGTRVDLPAPPSPYFPPGSSAADAVPTAQVEVQQSAFASSATEAAAAGVPLSEPLSSQTNNLMMPSLGTVDSWDQSEAAGAGGGGGGCGEGKNEGKDENTKNVAASAAEAHAYRARQKKLAAVWAEGLGYVHHAHPSFAVGSTLLAERRAALGSVAALVLQAFVRRVLGAAKVRKLKERLKQRRINQSRQSGQFGRSSRAPSRAGSMMSTSSRGSSGSKATTVRSAAGSRAGTGKAARSSSFRQSQLASRGSSRG